MSLPAWREKTITVSQTCCLALAECVWCIGMSEPGCRGYSTAPNSSSIAVLGVPWNPRTALAAAWNAGVLLGKAEPG